jgi:membrane protease YdiL (CAAX protease family)
MRQGLRQAINYGDLTKASTSRSGSPLAFFLLTFALAIPFWVLGEMIGVQLLPGLPGAALMFVCPGLAALILVHRESGLEGAKELLKRGFDYKRIKAKAWYAPILILNPAIAALSYAVLRLIGTPVPEPRTPILATLVLCVVFFIGALGEELGWSGYAIDPMQDRLGALRASLLLGIVWAVFHFVALGQAHRSVEWIAWWSLGTVSARVIMVWLYNHAGKSVFAAALFHATSNVSWQMFPIHGSFFDPRVSGLITAIVALVAAALSQLRPLRRRQNV